MNRDKNHTSVQSIAVKADNSAHHEREETVEDNSSVMVTPEFNGKAKISYKTQCAIYLDMKDLLWDAAKLSSAL